MAGKLLSSDSTNDHYPQTAVDLGNGAVQPMSTCGWLIVEKRRAEDDTELMIASLLLALALSIVLGCRVKHPVRRSWRSGVGAPANVQGRRYRGCVDEYCNQRLPDA